jgi:hypothetical protein
MRMALCEIEYQVLKNFALPFHCPTNALPHSRCWSGPHGRVRVENASAIPGGFCHYGRRQAGGRTSWLPAHYPTLMPKCATKSHCELSAEMTHMVDLLPRCPELGARNARRLCSVLHRAHSMLSIDRHNVIKFELRQLPVWKLLGRAAVVAAEDRCKVLWRTETAHLGNLDITQFGAIGEQLGSGFQPQAI